MQELSGRHRLQLLLGALAAVALPARALVLGDVEVRSALGEPLEARVALDVDRGQVAVGACFALLRDTTDPALPSIGEGVLNVEHRSNGATALRVRTLKPVTEPAVMLSLRVACPGEAADPVQRSYTLLLDPRPVPLPVAVRAIGARLDSQAGDTLDTLAGKVFPDDAAARRDYAAALRAANPVIAARGDATVARGEAVALPDLRSFPRSPAPVASAPPASPPRREPAASRVAAAPPSPPVAVAPGVPAAAKPAPAKPAVPAKPAAPVIAAPRTPAAAAPVAEETPVRPRGAGYVLRLSSAEVDLSRSRQIDDRMRAQLRERLLVLDADDQVAVLLSMRNSLKQLEARVAELQLKLSAMPASLASAVPPVKPSAPVAPPPERIAKPAQPVATPPAPPPIVATPQPIPAAPAATTAPAQDRLATPRTAPRTAPRPANDGLLPGWLWAVAGLLAVLAALLALWLWRRRSQAADASPEWAGEPADEDLPEPAALEGSAADEDAFEVAPEVRAEVSSDAELETRLPQDSGELRRRYIEERFPEIQNRTILLEDPASVVKGARLFYEDGAIPRAVELLQFATEDKPQEVRAWLALFEIFRLERLVGEYAALARRFHEQHGEGEHWRKVQFFGREIDPGNALYREAGVNTLETIGPREAKRLAAGLASAGSIDPIAENWLQAPMDFENEVLANDLRTSLMTGAGLVEGDLVANPMPALRSVEMFTVA